MEASLKLGNGDWGVKNDSLLAYDDFGGKFRPLPFDFTRASSATVVNKQGLIETVQSGIPRIDFSDDVNGALKLEPQSTNLIPYSELFSDAYWTKSGASVVSGFTSPDGTANAFKFVEGTNNGAHIIYKISIGFTSGATLSYSFFAKKGERNVIQTYNYVGGGFQNGADFDLSTGVVSNQFGGLGSMTELDNGWWRCNVTSLALVGHGATNVAIRTLDNSSSNSYQGDGTSGVYLYGAQLEQSSYPTSYIPTQGSAVTRVVESTYKDSITNVFGTNIGSFFVDAEGPYYNNAAGYLFDLSDNSTSVSNRFGLYSVNSTTLNLWTNGNHIFTADVKSRKKIAIIWNGTNTKMYLNGVKTLDFTYANANPTNINLNGRFTNQSYGNSKFNQVKAFSNALTDSEAIALTTI